MTNVVLGHSSGRKPPFKSLAHATTIQLRQALQMTQHETFRATEKFGQAMAWENVHLNDVDVVDKPGGLNNASGYIGLVPAHKLGIVLLANRSNFPHEIARYRVLPELAREEQP